MTWVKHPGFWGNGGTARSRHTRAAGRHFVEVNLAGMVWPCWAKDSSLAFFAVLTDAADGRPKLAAAPSNLTTTCLLLDKFTKML